MVAAVEQPQAPPLQFWGPAAEEVWGWMDGSHKPMRETLIEGGAGSGKTHTILQMIRSYCDDYPHSKWLFIRNEKSAMNETLLVEWEEAVLGAGHPMLKGRQPSRDNRTVYENPYNKSTVVCRGFDDEQKFFSGQFHGIFFNEATELKSEEKWETLHRALRAKKTHGQPFSVMVADCNPRQRSHWLNRRAASGRMRRIRTFLWDNPRWYDHERNDWTEEGREYVQALSLGLTGVNRTRLLLGLWENATGAVLPQFDENIHVIDARLEKVFGATLLHVKGWAQPVELRWFFASMDCGFQNAAVFGVWGMDPQGRLFEVAEIYRSQWTHEEWSQHVVALAKEFPLQGIACDHDPALIKALNIALTRANVSGVARIADKTLGRSDEKGQVARLELLRSLLQRRAIFYVKGCNRFVDDALKAKRLPWNTPMELPDLQHEEVTAGEDDVAKAEKIDKSFPNHGFDMTRYACAFAATRNLAQEGLARDARRWEDFWDFDAKKRRRAS